VAKRALVVVVAAAALATGAGGRSAVATACDGGAWRVAQSDVAWSEATGRHTATFVVVNDSRGACTLRGYPTIVLLDAGGRTLAFSYSHRGDQMITRDAPRSVRVGAGGRAFFAFDKYRCDLRATAVARFALVRLPGVHASERLRLARYPIIDFCAQRASLTIAVSPIVARIVDAAARR